MATRPSPGGGFPGIPNTRPRSLLGRAREAFWQEAREFCLLTGLHGYKYIVQPGKHTVERLFWLLVVVLSMAAAVYLMLIAYNFNRSHPTIMAVDTTHYPLWKVEVPGVTVCPSSKVMRSKALNLIRTWAKPAGMDDEELLSDMGLLGELVMPRAATNQQFARLQSIMDNNSADVDSVMRAVAPTCDEMLAKCVWKRRECLKCSDIFRLVRTAYGYCCSFNYIDKEIKKFRPRMGGCVGVSYQKVQRVSACGYTNGLSVAARVDPKEFLASILASHAIMVLIHNPWMYPDPNADLKVVGAGTVSFISYATQVTEASSRLARTLPPRIRKCLFSEEAFLPRFRSYTYENCMVSCRANASLEVCGCVPFMYAGGVPHRLCNLMDVPCLTNLTIPISHRDYINQKRCPQCHPLCTNVDYIVETSVGNLNWDNVPDGDILISNLGSSEENYAVFHVFANDLVTTRYKLDMYFTSEDLIGSLGGLSGLFVGFSLVSGFEFIYFFTVRPFFRMRARQAASRAASRTARITSRDSKHGAQSFRSSLPGKQISPTSPFPLVAPHVFRLRRRANQKEDRRAANNTQGASMIPVIE